MSDGRLEEMPGGEPLGLESVEAVQAALRSALYIADRALATSIYLALRMRRPLLLEGPAGVGKTEVARALSQVGRMELLRLQCYEGLDATHALYDWDYPRQLLLARVAAGGSGVDDLDALAKRLYSPEFLLERPLLRAIRRGAQSVLLIDELDRSDEEFEAFLLEFLGDFSVTIPELGTVVANGSPIVVITSNRTRELHDALTRRCLFHWLDHPSQEREAQIIQLRIPAVGASLAHRVAALSAKLRALDLVKPPGTAEAIDWAQALIVLGADLSSETDVRASLGWVVKNREDLDVVCEQIGALLRD
jgi:MoxR-like ATPase